MAGIEGQGNVEGKRREEETALSDSLVERIASLDMVTASAVEGEMGDEDSAEEDYEGDAWGGLGLRGFLQKAEQPWQISRQYFPSKAGGTPAWLDPVNLPKGKHFVCGICDKPLQFVLQVYAPAEDDVAAFHRTLFVFMCTSLACLKQDEIQQYRREKQRRSVKVFRSQLPRENPYYSSNPASEDGSELPFSQGASLCSFCGTWSGGKLCGGCKQTRYCSQSHQMAHWRGDHASYCRQVQELLKTTSAESEANSGSAITSRDVGTPTVAHPAQLWPEFELVVEDIGGEVSDDGVSDDNRTGRSGEGRSLADYERRKMQGKDFSAKDVQHVQESSLQEQQWASFQAKMAESPGQVLWYHRSVDAKPVWPRLDCQPKKAGDIPVCALCGGQRTFEFQILPQLLYFFEVQDDPDSLDWSTIAVYSCARSCTIQGYCEEFAWMQPGFPLEPCNGGRVLG